ncbi:hypothetical protein H261_23045 [Paramagnetospirillum caucaseum]|uniref:RNA polymerase sigma-70 region 2 domain-containing protein n=1 Tax=Paramagnetospirillum caucaseum TaxID=1244869 RepID=M2Y377_9PROT|nr:hypothetical protein H261_23045 [Paramagnetospirillum caucaseum]
METFIVLLARECLSQRLLRLLSETRGDVGWRAFESFFGADIKRIVRRRLPSSEREQFREDCYQEICLALIADDFRRIKAYQGRGSFAGFVLHATDRLLIDHIRHELSGRPRTEEGDRSPMRSALPIDAIGEIASEDPTPEGELLAIESERMLAVAGDVLKRCAETLTEVERLYVKIALTSGETVPAREVARLMRRPVSEVYKLKQRVMSRLRENLNDHPAVKNWRASV